MCLGKKIKRMRKSKGLTLNDIATKTGLDISTISNIESGRRDPSLDALEKIAHAMFKRVIIDFEEII